MISSSTHNTARLSLPNTQSLGGDGDSTTSTGVIIIMIKHVHPMIILLLMTVESCQLLKYCGLHIKDIGGLKREVKSVHIKENGILLGGHNVKWLLRG